ncbi:ATP-binding protein [Streptomyces aidingensis]|uniref:Serine/threonine-protein kinase RsbW n=1 Tax=Streptomyces aidingensis TaxID=910347 RepID=A0A1I1QER5_9ACTN|nr:ATP-binding protein [Streptomyces aidingensis]SFD20482.1 serine/threonine-protein kinase RsbW [Streptomyces aidingensis]
MSIWWSLQLRREAASVPLARRLLLGAMRTAGVEESVSYEISVALSEACSNAVLHGGGRSDSFRVTAAINGDVCRIEVTDSGPGFPAEVRRTGARLSAAAAVRECDREHEQEHGRGLRLIEALADRVRFRNQPGEAGGAVVSIDKILTWREDALLHAS